ncbi:major facilitator superfamily domain-containing protein [Zopfochytrium polystomum]|nr:major facilitator superfamily domain-containing protein [Zopfochytrium polystomum]
MADTSVPPPGIQLRRTGVPPPAADRPASLIGSNNLADQQDENDNAPYVDDEDPARGWPVVFGASAMLFVTLGLVYSFGIVQDILISARFASASVLGWASSLSIVMMPVLAVPCTNAVHRFGNRAASIAGSLLLAAGYLCMSWAVGSATDSPGQSPTPTSTVGDGGGSLPLLFVAQALVGTGYALAFWASNSIAAAYFTRHRALAVGIVYSASGIGGAAFSLALQAMAASPLRLPWSLRVCAAVALAITLPCSFLLVPRRRPADAFAAFKPALLKDPSFVLLLVATGLATFPIFVPPFFLPTYATSAGLDRSVGAALVAGYNLASGLGRILFGVLADSAFGPVSALGFALFLAAASILAIWTVSNSLATLILFLVVNGSSSGAILSLQPPVNAAIFGIHQAALTLSMTTSSRAFGMAFGGPIAGYLLDAFGGPHAGTQAYRPALLVMGSLCLLSASLIAALRYRLGGFRLDARF